MTGTASPALRTAPAYHEAWTSHNLDKAMSYIAGDIASGAWKAPKLTGPSQARSRRSSPARR